MILLRNNQGDELARLDEQLVSPQTLWGAAGLTRYMAQHLANMTGNAVIMAFEGRETPEQAAQYRKEHAGLPKWLYSGEGRREEFVPVLRLMEPKLDLRPEVTDDSE